MNRRKTSVLLFGLAAVSAGAWLRAKRRIDFKGKTVVLSGGTRGLGFLLAQALLDEGARVAICGRNINHLEAARSRLNPGKGELFAVQGDITDPRFPREFIEAVEQRFGEVEILINNAGVIRVGPIETMGEQDYAEMLGVYFWGPYRLVQAVLPGMKRRRFGRIANIASIGGRIPAPHIAAYTVGKFAQVGFSEALRTELWKDGILVTTVTPGMMRTGSHLHAEFRGDYAKEFAWFSTGNALPLIGVDARRAADKILNAIRYGRAFSIPSTIGKLAHTAHRVSPRLTQSALSFINTLLPQNVERSTRRGEESDRSLTPEFIARRSDAMADVTNQALTH